MTSTTPPNPIGPTITGRRHDIDALRALAFLLLVLYHVGMYYVAGWAWHVKSPQAAEWLRWPMLAVNIWRMDLVFLVSGLAFGFLCRGRTPFELVRQRAHRLLLPLAFGMVVVVPYQAYAQAVANGSIAPGFVDFMARYLRMGPWPKGAFDGSDFGMTWNHLWYLPYLFLYTAVLALLSPVMRSRPMQRLRAAFEGLRGWRLLLLPALPLVACNLVLAPRFPATHDLIHDGYLHALYFTVFLYGHWLGVEPGTWSELKRRRRIALAAAAACLLLFLAVRLTPFGIEAGVAGGAWIVRALRALYLWTAIAAILGYAHRYLDRPWPWLGWANESVYPWYMLHQTLIVMAAVALAPFELGPWLEPALLIGITVLGCRALTDGLIRRVGWLRPLFGLKPAASRPRPADPAELAQRQT